MNKTTHARAAHATNTAEEPLYYCAYGSNLHPLRLIERCPTAQFIEIQTLSNYELVFNKIGADGSAKCSLIPSLQLTKTVYTAIYTLSIEDKKRLDAFEGSGYAAEQIQIRCRGSEVNGLIYLAEPDYIDNQLLPYHWYKELVYLGACHHGFPPHYLAAINASPWTQDPDARRVEAHTALIERLRRYTANPM